VLFSYYGLKQIDEDKIGSYATVRLHALVGKVIHEFIQQFLSIHYKEVPVYIKANDHLVIKGFIDGIYFAKQGGNVKTIFLEIKTIYDRNLTKRFTGLQKHWLQLKLYTLAFSGNCIGNCKLELALDVYPEKHKSVINEITSKHIRPNYMQLMYIDKTFQIGADYIQPVNLFDKDFAYLTKRIAFLSDTISQLKVPELKKQNFIDLDSCRFCPYENYCKQNPGVIYVDKSDDFTFKQPTNIQVYKTTGGT